MKPKVSVVIPCFNQGSYVEEAVDSVLQQTYKNYEIIIVNDGSTDAETNQLLHSFSYPHTNVIRSQNYGLANARNTGISASEGRYILPLDADDKIGSTYLDEAVKILEENSNIGIVYCNAEFFGGKSGPFDLPSFSKDRLLVENIIFCTAFFRKDDWRKIGGFNPNMNYGWEDWDFWLSIIELDRDAYRIPETLFFHRKRANSMCTMMNSYQKTILRLQVIENHRNLYKDVKTKSLPFLGYAQLFIDTGKGFNQSESIFHSLQGYHDTIEFEISNYDNIESLRFDPINDCAEVRIIRSQVAYKDGRREDLRCQQDNALNQEDGFYLFDHEDPQLLLQNREVVN